MLSDGLQIRMAEEADPPTSRGSLSRKIACDDSNDVNRYITFEDSMRRKAADDAWPEF